MNCYRLQSDHILLYHQSAHTVKGGGATIEMLLHFPVGAAGNPTRSGAYCFLRHRKSKNYKNASWKILQTLTCGKRHFLRPVLVYAAIT